jgi:hypothetical protein
MMSAMCICITHARVSYFTCYYHVTCAITSWHDVFNKQFIFVLCFYWLILPHLHCHINYDWLHVERFQGWFLKFGQIKFETDCVLQYI